MQKTISILAFAALAGTAQSQVASADIREGDTIATGEVTSISNSAANGIGGYAFTANSTMDGETISNIWGNFAGGAAGVIRSEGTFGDLQQVSFESFFGIGNSSTGYSASTTRLSDMTTGLDGVWAGDTVVLNEEDPIGALFSSFGSRPGMTHDNRAYWVGGLTDTQGGGTQNRALFLDGNILFTAGDSVAGLGTSSGGGAVDFDFRFSELGNNWLSPIDFDTGSTLNDIALVLNNTALMAGGGFVREADAIGMGVGALAGESWDNFDFMGVNEAGDVFFTGDTDADVTMDEFVFQNGQIVLREGDTAGGLTISGSIEGGSQNSTGDWGVIWDVDDALGNNLEALIVNGDLLLTEGDAVDWNGDGVIDANDLGASIDNFTGISSLTLGTRDQNGAFDVLFTADVTLDSGEVLEGGFRLNVPTPASSIALVAGGLLAARRRR